MASAVRNLKCLPPSMLLSNGVSPTRESVQVLLYGPNREMLEARKGVLELIGHQVWVATSLAEIRRIVNTVDRVDLLVLGHSLSRQECGRAITLIHARWPGARICVLAPGNGSLPAGVAGEVFAAFTGPAKFGERFEQLVSLESSACSHLY